MERQFCYLCSGRLTQTGGHSWRCQECEQRFYRNGQAATAAIILNQHDEVLLAVRAREPGKGMYDVPGGFTEPGESLEAALLRELTEETSITEQQLFGLTYLTSGSNQYAWGRETIYTMDAVFFARLKQTGASLQANDDVASLTWTPLQAVEAADIFVPAAAQAIEQLKHDIDIKA